MTHAPVGAILRRLRNNLDPSGSASVADAELLERFTRDRDETAFELLVWRHQRMVLGVCRRVLHNVHDAEDAFQATFLALARKAGCIARGEALAGWLYRVACRVALHARARRTRRPVAHGDAALEAAQTPEELPSEVEQRDLRATLDEEVSRLPEKYRIPVVLCYLQGVSYREAGRQLRVPLGTIAARLNRARALLQGRLARRGVGFCAATFATLLGRQTAPAALMQRTVNSALGVTTGQAVEGMASSRVAALVDQGLRGVAPSKVKILAAVLFAALFLSTVASRLSALGDRPSARNTAVSLQADRRPPIADGRDALPAGALTRLGTARWRHSAFVSSVAFLPDSKSLISAGEDGIVRVWDREGRELHRLGQLRTTTTTRRDFRAGPAIALSADGKQLATADGGEAIHFHDPATGKELGTIQCEKQFLVALAFSPENKRLAASGMDGTIHYYDLIARKWKRRFNEPPVETFSPMTGREPALVFSSDGRFLASSAREPGPQGRSMGVVVRLWDAATGKLLHKIAGPEGEEGAASPAFSPDGELLAWTDLRGRIHLTQTTSGKEVRRIDCNLTLYFAFAPDGKTLYTHRTDGSVSAWEVATGKGPRRLVRELDGPQGVTTVRYDVAPRALAVSPDGKTLAVGGERNVIRLIDTTTGKERHAVGGHGAAVAAVSWSADGKTLTSQATENTIRVWEAATGKEKTPIHLPGGAFTYFTLSPDGRTLATTAWEGAVQLWDTVTGRQRHRIEAVKGTVAPTSVFTPDGKLLAVWGLGQTSVRLFGVGTGKEVRSLPVGDGIAPDPRGLVTVPPLAGAGMVFSPDGSLLALRNSARTVGVWNVVSGRQVRQLLMPADKWFGSATFSRDARCLAVETGDGTVVVWELASGQERRRITKSRRIEQPWPPPLVGVVPGRVMPVGFGVNGPGSTLALSPDGLLLAQADGTSTRILDLESGKERARLAGHQGEVTTVSFSPDGRCLATGSSDTTVLVWDVAAFTRTRASRAVELSTAALQERWTALAGDDPGKAFDAICTLAAAKQTVPFLKERLNPAVAPNAEQVAKWIADLDSKKFEIRRKAGEELRRLGAAVVPALRQALENSPPLERRRRLEELLGRIETQSLSAEELQVWRAIEVLERLGTSEARRLLDALAGGAAEALPTTAARAALNRLGH
jgi:RNA polymerase sigma factor (sigma-70 family)